MPSHAAFGLTVQCARALTGFPLATDLRADVIEIRIDEGLDAPPTTHVMRPHGRGMQAAMVGLGVIDIAPPRSAVLNVAHETASRWEELVQPALGGLLHLRGAPVLHACTVAWGDRAAIIMGPSGRGKTTLSEACVDAGAQWVTDDLTVLDRRNGSVQVMPGPAAYRLVRPDAPNVLGAAGGDKSYLATSSRAEQPVRAVLAVQLEDTADVDDAMVFQVMMPSAGALALLGATFAPGILGSSSRFEQLAQLSLLADSMRVAILRRPRRKDAIAAAVDVIRATVESTP